MNFQIPPNHEEQEPNQGHLEQILEKRDNHVLSNISVEDFRSSEHGSVDKETLR